ncbi:MAG: hypothetical protein LAT65_02665 [Saccharospirillum sp.]|nr:hypothetical protein [Saccharospirillum sp.]
MQSRSHFRESSAMMLSWLRLGIFKQFRITALATLVILLLAACEGGTADGNGSDVNGTPESRGGTLSSNSGIEGEAGSVVLAVDGALDDDEEVEVLLEIVPIPTDSADLSEGVEALGSAFALSSDRPVRTSPDAPFLMGLPVPEGADADQLGIAVLDFDTLYAPPDSDDVSGLKRQWAYLDAVVDTETNLVISPLLGLTPEPMVAIVVESEAFNSSRILARNSVTGAEFVGTCGPGFLFADETCTSADRSAAAAMLEQAYNNLTLFGFTDEPALKRGIGSVDISHQGGFSWSISYVPGPYQIQLRPRSKEDAGGMYSSSSGRVWIAIGTDGVTEDRRRIVRHEYIHATQYAGFDGFASTEDWLASRWVIEGQAVVAETSFTAIERRNRDPRVVDTTLERSYWTGSEFGPGPASEYMAQDLWWYLVQRFNADISLLQPFMDRGLAATDVHATLRAEYPDDFGSSGPLGGLPQAYWDWVKNQVFEKGVPMDDSRFGDTCAFTLPAATPSALTYTPFGENGTVSRTLPPLTAEVVQVMLPSGDGWLDTLRVDSNSGYVRSTIYQASGSGGTQGCIGQGDSNSRTLMASDSAQTYYVVIANTSMNNENSFTVAFDGTAGIEIVTPNDGASLDEGEIDFSATLAGFDAPTDIRWTYRRPADGLLWTFLERTESGETTSWTLCDGDYEITAEAMQGSTVMVSTSIDLSLEDLGDSNPPNACRPEVSIQEPIEGLNYLAGEPLPLKADIQNTGSAVLGPRYDIEWRIGGPTGTLVGTGLNDTTSFDEGAITLYVSYGVASDTVTFNSLAATNDPPSASITSPEDEAMFGLGSDEFGEGGDGYTITFTGTGSSPQEGSITGAALTWEYRRTDGTGTNWINAGSGETVDIFFAWQSCTWQYYDVRVTATDSQDLSASDTISIGTQPPVC